MRTIDSNVFIALWILSAFTWHVTCKTRSASTGKHTHASNSSNVCNTPACHIRAKFIKAALNNNYKPCDSFYDHVCNNWIFYNPIPDDKSLTSVLNGLDDQLNRDLLRVFENTTYKTERQNVTDKVLASYHNCINTSISEKKQFYALYEVLKRVGGEYWPVWPRPHVREVLPTWDQLLTRIHNEMDINLIFVVGVAKDPDNVTDKIIHLQRPKNPAGLQQFRNRHRLQRKVTMSPRDKAYLSLMASCIKTFNPRLSYKKVKEVMIDILWFESKIAKIVEAAKNKSTEHVTYYKMTIADLRNISEHVDWLQFFQRLFDPVNITLTPQEPVALSELYYFKTAIDFIMRNTSRYTTYNYMIWRLIRNLGDVALPRFRKLAFRMSQASRGVRRDVSLRERCVDYVNEVMDFPAGRLYVQRYFSKEAKKDIIELVRELKDAFRKSIRKTRWMDRSTKAEALKKLDNMVTQVGYADSLLNDTYMNEMFKEVDNVPPGQPFLLSYISFRKQWAKINLRALHRPWNRQKDWSAGPAIVNAYYYPQLNGITFPAGVLQPPVFEYGVPMYMNLGAIGTIIGHEVTHAFDDTGCQFDSEGNLHNWWTNRTKTKFLKRVTCFKEQYGNITDERIKMKLDGAKTKGENTADNGGIHQAYRAYRFWAAKNKIQSLPGLQNFTADQLFFISVALTWCTNPRAKRLKAQIYSDEHAPARYRINVPLSNMPEFARAFKCPKGSPMYSKKRCVLW